LFETRQTGINSLIVISVSAFAPRFFRLRLSFALSFLLWLRAGCFVWGVEPHQLGSNEEIHSSNHFATNVAQFRAFSGADYLEGCNFQLTGVVTLVDTNRDLVVIQDATGSVALNFNIQQERLSAGLLVTLDGVNCRPYFASFPNYPYRPSGRDIQDSFEAPMNWGEYHLTRMRGFLRPTVTGNYGFWIASDNSSELWLSSDADPSKARKIAFVRRFDWVDPHEWTRFPSQHSGPIFLKAGETYYIEALQEQTTEADHLSVAWQVPSQEISVIEGMYLTPWSDNPTPTATNGILREYWTNYTAGNLSDLGEARRFQSALTVERVNVNIHGRADFPKAERIPPDQRLSSESNYRWIAVEGAVKFSAANGHDVSLELFDGQRLIQVRALHDSPEKLKKMTNVTVRVEGVCEGIYDQAGTLVPGLIWASASNSISYFEAANTNGVSSITEISQPVIPSNSAIQGFYTAHGVVTFNGPAFGNDYIFVQQQDMSVVRITPGNRPLKDQLKVGHGVEVGGPLKVEGYLQEITPLVVTEVGLQSMPTPVVQPPDFPKNAEGRWSEFDGVVQSVNTNGTLTIVNRSGTAYLWLHNTPSNSLPRYVDAKLRVRGVLLLSVQEEPVLLVPSTSYIDLETEPPKNIFAAPKISIGEIFYGEKETSLHRVSVVGEITYRDAKSFFIQDASGGIRVRTPDFFAFKVGDTVEVVAFPQVNAYTLDTGEQLVRSAPNVERINARNLDLSEPLLSKQKGTLINVNATLLNVKTNQSGLVFELQERQRVFVATLASPKNNLPLMPSGSRLQLTGVCDDSTGMATLVGEKSPRTQMLSPLNILLRSAQDVKVISGPPWWTWKRTATLVGTLLTVLFVTLLWVYLLRRRLERQKAAQLAFSRQVLERLEDEKQRIAVNLHDSLGQTLLVIKNHAILASQTPTEGLGVRKRLSEISSVTSNAIEEVRRITHGLRPYQLDRLGLTQAIRASVSGAAENSTISFASRVEDIDGLFNTDAEIHVYRIVQEAVTNIVKHSMATEAAVVIKKRPTTVSLSIRDNGKGFNPTKPTSRPHDLGYGLSGIAERVRILNGVLTIDSRLNEGSNLTLEIPLPIRK
jgi:signal transduction histidine kinase